MKGFSVDRGDVVVNKTIPLVEGIELLQQKAELVIGTNKGEWIHDLEEGIDYHVILRKNPDEGEIRQTIEEALKRLDETFVITSFELTMKGRDAVISFKAVNDNDEEVGGEYNYGS